MKRLLLLLLFVGLSCTELRADLVLSGESVSWDLANPSPTLTLFTVDTSTSPPLPLVYAWSLGLQIEPGPGAQGTVEFETATLPSTDYIYEGRSSGLTPPLTLPSTTIPAVGDSDSVFPSTMTVPTPATLLALTFKASSNARGDFLIKAIPDPTVGSYWLTSDDAVNFEERPFLNVPFGGGSVEIGSLSVVPEPGSFLLMAAVSSLAGCWCLIRRFR